MKVVYEMKLTMDDLIELRNSAQYKLYHEREWYPKEKLKLEESLYNLGEVIDEMKKSVEIKSQKLMVDDNLVIYSNGNNIMKSMTVSTFAFETGTIQTQYEGDDIARHGSSVYETITEIKNLNEDEKIVINNYERNEFLQKDFCKVSELGHAVQKQYDSLDEQIKMYQKQQEILLNNYHKVLNTFEQKDLSNKEESELEELER